MSILTEVTALVERAKSDIATYGPQEAAVAKMVATLLTGHAAALAETAQGVVATAESVVNAIPAPAAPAA